MSVCVVVCVFVFVSLFICLFEFVCQYDNFWTIWDIKSTSYCCQRYAECLVTTLFQQDSAPSHRAAHVQQLNWCVKKRQTFLHPTCGLQTAQVSVLWTTRSGLSSCHAASCLPETIHSVDELKRRLIDVWCGLEQSIFDEAINQWRGRLRACVHAKGGHFEYSLWTDDVDFVYICYIRCDLFDCYILNYEIMPATLASTKARGYVTYVCYFLSASLYVSKRGAYWDRLCRDVVGRWSLVGCHARALWPNGAS